MAIMLDVCIVAQLSEYGKKPDVSYCEAIVVADILPQLWTCLASATVAPKSLLLLVLLASEAAAGLAGDW